MIQPLSLQSKSGVVLVIMGFIFLVLALIPARTARVTLTADTRGFSMMFNSEGYALDLTHAQELLISNVTDGEFLQPNGFPLRMNLPPNAGLRFVGRKKNDDVVLHAIRVRRGTQVSWAPNPFRRAIAINLLGRDLRITGTARRYSLANLPRSPSDTTLPSSDTTLLTYEILGQDRLGISVVIPDSARFSFDSRLPGNDISFVEYGPPEEPVRSTLRSGVLVMGIGGNDEFAKREIREGDRLKFSKAKFDGRLSDNGKALQIYVVGTASDVTLNHDSLKPSMLIALYQSDLVQQWKQIIIPALLFVLPLIVLMLKRKVAKVAPTYDPTDPNS